MNGVDEDSFLIGFESGSRVDEDGEWAHLEIRFGTFRESMDASLGFWSKEQYAAQWNSALKEVLSSCAKSALITDIFNPCLDANAWIWPIWREGKVVYFQNRLVVYSQLKYSFDPVHVAEIVSPRREANGEGQKLSEWRMASKAVEEFLLSTVSENKRDRSK